MVEEAKEGEWTHAAACLINQGGLRTDIDQGRMLIILFKNILTK